MLVNDQTINEINNWEEKITIKVFVNGFTYYETFRTSQLEIDWLILLFEITDSFLCCPSIPLLHTCLLDIQRRSPRMRSFDNSAKET